MLGSTVAVVFASLFFHPYGAVKAVKSLKPLLAGADVNPSVFAIAERSCKNCHSEGTEWPWYSYVAPMSWLIEGDVYIGRWHMNLSHWDEYRIDEKQLLLSEIAVMVRNRKMPLPRCL